MPSRAGGCGSVWGWAGCGRIEACGVDFDTRGARADEQLQLLRALWADTSPDGLDHHGRFFHLDGAMSYPKPVRPGGVPLHVGGHSRVAARRAGRFGDGLQPLGVHGEELAGLVGLMREEAEKAGRDSARLELSLGHLASRIDAAQGADRVVLAVEPTTEIARVCDELSACAERLGL